MTCQLCRHGNALPGTTTVVLRRGEATIVIKGVPADVCENCGEAYLAEAIAERVYAAAESAVRSGAEVEIRRFAA
ncbi:MAG TPA: type II toxin-antitoxin system MqsA family antitoxin [Polyangia bacterium]|jgi:YgiT-type zinc finger domain-containing protein|nr:type II toxin-antitoxin system MqsA family antitoxin [Polyangia bacterium]